MSDAPARKYCEDCAHIFVPPSGLEYARCLKAFAPLKDDRFVSKKFDGEIANRYCSAARADTEACGPTAVWFEPKEGAA